MFGGNFAPAGWAFCEGQLLPISENDALFNLIGTTYGGDGQSTFGLPNLSGRVPVHQGQGPGLSNRTIGELGGVESVTLTTQQLGGHTHALVATQNVGNQSNPQGQLMAAGTNVLMFRTINPQIQMAANIVGVAGGSQPHDNMMPYLVIDFIISLFGIFPSQT
jgi:microcystin-dependent protein